MNSKGTVFWVMISLVLGGSTALQWWQRKAQQERLHALQAQVERLSTDARKARGEVEELQKERSELRGELVAARAEATPPSQKLPVSTSPIRDGSPSLSAPTPAGAASSSGKPNMGNMLGNMMKDPEMRKAMEQQQRMGLNMIYAGLFKDLQLAPEQEQKLKEALLDKQMANMTQAGALMGAGAANRTEIAAKLAEDQKARDEQIHQLLGDDKYNQYQDYQQTLGERMLLEQLGGDLALNPDQKTQLLNIMREEKKNIQINTGGELAGAGRDPQAILGSQEAMDKILAQQEQVNARVLERSGQVLSPDQVRKLEPVLKSQIDMQRAGVKMAREMFNSEPTPSPEGVK